MCHVSETPFINEDPAIQSGAYDETKTLAGKGYGKCPKVENSRLPLRFSDPTCEKSSADSTRFPWRKKKKERKAKINSRKILHLTKDNHFLRKKKPLKGKVSILQPLSKNTHWLWSSEPFFRRMDTISPLGGSGEPSSRSDPSSSSFSFSPLISRSRSSRPLCPSSSSASASSTVGQKLGKREGEIRNWRLYLEQDIINWLQVGRLESWIASGSN